jgi:hypothetical protein
MYQLRSDIHLNRFRWKVNLLDLRHANQRWRSLPIQLFLLVLLRFRLDLFDERVLPRRRTLGRFSRLVRRISSPAIKNASAFLGVASTREFRARRNRR